MLRWQKLVSPSPHSDLQIWKWKLQLSAYIYDLQIKFQLPASRFLSAFWSQNSKVGFIACGWQPLISYCLEKLKAEKKENKMKRKLGKASIKPKKFNSSFETFAFHFRLSAFEAKTVKILLTAFGLVTGYAILPQSEQNSVFILWWTKGCKFYLVAFQFDIIFTYVYIEMNCPPVSVLLISLKFWENFFQCANLSDTF